MLALYRHSMCLAAQAAARARNMRSVPALGRDAGAGADASQDHVLGSAALSSSKGFLAAGGEYGWFMWPFSLGKNFPTALQW